MLMYACASLLLTHSQLTELNVCWNNVLPMLMYACQSLLLILLTHSQLTELMCVGTIFSLC